MLAGLILQALCGVSALYALPASHYADKSALSEGKWVKIRVSQTGMQFISNSQLSQMGFSNPSAVNVYGFGGRMIKEVLDSSHPDDLPQLPVVRTATGILFFGVDNTSWQPSATGPNFTHTNHAYAESSYYFISDRPAESMPMQQADLRSTDGLQGADSFIERLVHEKDMFAPSVTGRTLLGEDLRTAQQINFSLPDNVGKDATIGLTIGSRLPTATGSLRISSSNATLSQNSLTVEQVKSSEQFMRTNTARINATKVGDNLNLGLSFSSSGVIDFARLDFVEVEYERALSLRLNQLYFYFNESYDVAATLEGASAETEIWDVSDAHKPVKVAFTLKGSQAVFKVGAGYREFVAFNPSKGGYSVENAGNVSNQNIHGLDCPDMLIITPSEYYTSALRIADLHREQDGMTVHVLTPQSIYNEFSSGTPDVSAFRKVMKMWYDRHMASPDRRQIKYCLILSRPTYDNKMVSSRVKADGYPRIPIWQSPAGVTENTSYSTDDFIGMLEDNPVGTLNMGQARINVAVGRFPVRSAAEAENAVDKLLAYVSDPGRESWRNNVLMLADDQDSGQHLDQTEKMYANMIASDKGKDYQYERLYLDNFERQLTSVGMEYPGAKKRLMDKLEEGQALMTYIGHANTVSWTHEHLLNWHDITSFKNTRLPVLYAATCEFARWDADEYSGAEVLWANRKSGFIAMICPSRSVFINMNGPLSAQFGKYALIRNSDGSPTRLGDSYVNMKNGITSSDDNKLRYALMGDPAMRMPVYGYNVEIDSIYGADITDPKNDLPVLEARSNPKLKGRISDSTGNTAEDFNGFIYLKLYDAEKVIETLGNGEDGKVMIYNDRKTKLFEGVAKIDNGKWETTVYMPAEIENNFTPGRLTLYALADDGREANGSTEKFYVYGYDANAPEDNQGPDILSFYLNNPGFKDGDVSFISPVVFASFEDESGINISDVGIGHSIMLSLDGKTVYSDIQNFYSPDKFDNRRGSIIYPLPEITAGKHKLTLTVWDCANNSSTATLHFNAAAVKEPDIYDIATIFNSDRSGVDFIVTSDRPMANLKCNLEVFDINGVRMWHSEAEDRTDTSSALRLSWDFTTASGNRVNNGIYIVRATLTSPEGKTARKSKKLVITQ